MLGGSGTADNPPAHRPLPDSQVRGDDLVEGKGGDVVEGIVRASHAYALGAPR